jgi:uncharacterized protein (DUF608 family)
MTGFLFTATITGLSYGFAINGTAATTRLEGVPLGGMGSGCFNFLPNGTYNRDWVQTQPPTGMEPTIMVYTKSGTTTWSTQALTTAAGMGITYTGYWPTVTNVYTNASLTIKLTLDAFSPLHPGSDKDCSMPLAFFVFTLENTTAAVVIAAVACKDNATASVITSGGKVQGIAGNNITMMVKNSDTTAQVTSGATVSDFTADGLLSNVAGGILASEVVLQPSEKKTITFVIAWDNVDGYYKTWLTTSAAIAQYGYDSAEALKANVDNWHNKILNSNLPDWYKDVLINNCHVLNSTFVWNANGYCYQEESSNSGGKGCFDQSYYSSIIVPLFAPKAEYFQMKAYADVQSADGQIWHNLDDNSAKSDINSEFALCLLRDYLWTGDTNFSSAGLYSTAKKALQCNRNDNANGSNLPNNQYSTFDQPQWDGWMATESEYCGEVWIAGLKAGQKLASITHNATDSSTYQGWYTLASTTFEKANGQGGFWNNTTAGPTGLKGYYTGSSDITSNGGKGLACWASQLAGQWYSDMLQLGLLHPQGRIDSLIAYTAAINTGSRGYYLAMLPDKSNWFGKWPGSNADGEQWPWFPPAHFGGTAISQGFADIGLDCINRQWKSNYSGQVTAIGPIPWSSPVFMMIDGTDANDSWGRYRYMNPPGVFSTLFAITGFSIDVKARKVWIKPSIPTSMNHQLVKAPLINPVSCGTIDYSETPLYGQNIKIAFDGYLAVADIRLRDQNPGITPGVLVTKYGNPIHPTVTRSGSGKSAEIALLLPSGGTMVDSAGLIISIYDPSAAKISAAYLSAANKTTRICKSTSAGAMQLLKGCSPTDMVEVYDLKGSLVAKSSAALIVKSDKARLAETIYVYKIRTIR